MVHSFDIDHAEKYGVIEAVILKTLIFWIKQNKARGTHYHEGRTWTYNTVSGYQQIFPYLSTKMIRTAFYHLVDNRVLITSKFNKFCVDQTKWYALADENNFLSEAVPEKANAICPNGQLGFVQTGKPIPDTNQIKKQINRPERPSIISFTSSELQTVWEEWIQYMAEKKKKLTPSTKEKQIEFLKQFEVKVAIDIINRSIQNGWIGLFPPDQKKSMSPINKAKKFYY